MSHIFISYSHKDADYVHKLQSKLQKEGFEVWVDDRIDYGEEWPMVIQDRLDECDAFILIATENSYKSKWVRKEVTRAQRINKAFFPLLLGGQPWLIIESTQYVDVRNKSLPTEKFYENLARVIPRKEIIKQESELKKMESQAIKYELIGDFWNARKTWYDIKRIDPLFPRVDIKIGELEREIAGKAEQEKAKRESAELAKFERTRRQAARKTAIAKLFSNVKPFLRVIGILGIVIVIFWGGSLLISKFNPPLRVTPTNVEFIPTKALTSTPYAGPIKEITDDKDVKMVLVPEGEFIMGWNILNPDMAPIHPVNLSAYYIDKYEVTNAQYKLCVDKGLCGLPNSAIYDDLNFLQYPIVGVNWYMAKAYCEKWRGEGSRLPSEAEWEKAARGSNELIYPWGGKIDKTYANYNNNEKGVTGVSYYEKGKSLYGVYNMAGNVWEWVADWYSEVYYLTYSKNQWPTDPKGPDSGQDRVIRGGSWSSISYELYTFYRDKQNPTSASDNVGFRCAMDGPP